MRRLASGAGRAAAAALFATVFLWCLGVVWFSDIGPPAARSVVVILAAVALPVIWFRGRNRLAVTVGFYAAAALLAALWQLESPSNDREWTADMIHAPSAEFDGDLVHIRNLRNNVYRSPVDFDVRYENRTFDLRRIRSVDFMVEEIWDWFEGSAHTLLTFGFEDDEYVAVSVELRREVGESFHPVAGIFRQFELMYVIGDERDLLRLRTNYRKDKVFLYPIKASPEVIRRLFVDMLERANDLRERPEFYNTFLNSCTTNLVDHVNRVVPDQVPASHRILLPGYSDRLAYDLNLIDTDLAFEHAKALYRIDERARRIDDDPRFSTLIRRP